MPQIFMIGEPNGAGKTTSAMTLLPKLLQCKEYINADAIASGLSPFHPEATALQSGRLMLERIHFLINQNQDFSFETTMASRSFLPLLQTCQHQGYSINLIFLWLQDVNLAIKRVEERVKNGGHAIAQHVVRRRYERGVNNFFQLYMPLANEWFLYDNSKNRLKMVANETVQYGKCVFDGIVWERIRGKHDRNTS